MNKHYIFIAILGFFVLILLVTGFIETGGPLSTRAIALDQKRMSHISNISYQIQSFYEDNGILPKSLFEVKTLSSTYKDPETNKQYEYRVTSPTSYNLCAKFSTDSKEVKAKLKKSSDYYDDYSDYGDTKDHKKGNDCLTYDLNAEDSYGYKPAPTPIASGSGSIENGNISRLSFNYKLNLINEEGDITLTNAYLSSAKDGVSISGQNNLFIEYTVSSKLGGSFQGGYAYLRLNSNDLFEPADKSSSLSLDSNGSGKIYELFYVDPSLKKFSIEYEEVDQTQVVDLDFSKANTVKGSISLDKGFSPTN
ncbi:MAG: hypothetical protein ACD_37C00160G0004 [uncultured bacterium]|nr:MAG: hypothetical protein ACD_37C00160G0004 [uncultured bacterium]